MRNTVNWNTILLTAVVCVAALAGYCVYKNLRNRELDAKARIAESEREKAHSLERVELAKEAAANRAAEEAKSRAEAEKSRADAERLTAENQKRKIEIAKLEERKAAELKQAALLKSKEAEDTLQAEKLRHDAVKIEAEKAKNIAKLEAKKASELASAKESELQLQKAKSEALKATAEIQEMKKIDFENWAVLLQEKEMELNEREKALMPEKTAADLQWVAEREASVIGQATNNVRVKKFKLAEDNPYLSRSSRELSRAERLSKEEVEKAVEIVRSDIIKYLEAKYIKAFKEDRMVDADYYKNALKSFYPKWKYAPEEGAEEKQTKKEDLTGSEEEEK